MINIQYSDDDNECFKWCLVKYVHSADHNPRRTTKVDKDVAKKTLDFKDIKFPVKIRDIPKIEKNYSVGVCVFGYENKEQYPVFVSKTYF